MSQNQEVSETRDWRLLALMDMILTESSQRYGNTFIIEDQEEEK